ncbi:MAG: GNAT family protein [Pseudomonadota bacterium]
MAVMEKVQTARQLRAEGKIKESFELLKSSQEKIHDSVLWQHQPLFWADLKAGNCLLTRRRGSDAAFISELWSDAEFVQRFHRMALRIPQQQSELARVLNSEYVSLISDLNSLHWMVKDKQGKAWGILSLTNISLSHKRAEVLLGVKADAPFGLATAAMLVLFRFYFEVLKFHKLYTLTFDDNAHPLRGVLHLGFKEEGRFREHFHDQSTGQFVDMVQAGLLAEEAFSAGNKRLMQRLLN